MAQGHLQKCLAFPGVAAGIQILEENSLQEKRLILAQGFRGFAWAQVPGQTILASGVCGKDDSVPGAQEVERD